LATVAALAGCGGGGSSATQLEDVRPCLDRLAVATARHFNGTITTPTGAVTTIEAPRGVGVAEWFVDLSYPTSSPGANVAHLAFYKSAADAKSELRRTRAAAKDRTQALNANFRNMLAQTALVGDSVLVGWSSPPTTRQKRRLAACFE
jgi:hypothetical protein